MNIFELYKEVSENGYHFDVIEHSADYDGDSERLKLRMEFFWRDVFKHYYTGKQSIEAGKSEARFHEEGYWEVFKDMKAIDYIFSHPKAEKEPERFRGKIASLKITEESHKVNMERREFYSTVFKNCPKCNRYVTYKMVLYENKCLCGNEEYTDDDRRKTAEWYTKHNAGLNEKGHKRIQEWLA